MLKGTLYVSGFKKKKGRCQTIDILYFGFLTQQNDIFIYQWFTIPDCKVIGIRTLEFEPSDQFLLKMGFIADLQGGGRPETAKLFHFNATNFIWIR